MKTWEITDDCLVPIPDIPFEVDTFDEALAKALKINPNKQGGTQQ